MRLNKATTTSATSTKSKPHPLEDKVGASQTYLAIFIIDSLVLFAFGQPPPSIHNFAFSLFTPLSGVHVYQAHSNSLDGLHLAGLPGSYPTLSSEEEQISEEEEVTTIEPPAAPMALLDLVTSDEDVEEVMFGMG